MKLSKPILKSFTLASDPDGEATILVRQAREGENLERSQMFAKTRYSTNAFGETGAEQDINPAALHRKEAYLSLGRVTGLVDDKDRELFKSKETDEIPSVRAAMSETEFNRAWGLLPPEMVKEIMDAIYDVNPDWDPTRPGE